MNYFPLLYNQDLQGGLVVEVAEEVEDEADAAWEAQVEGVASGLQASMDPDDKGLSRPGTMSTVPLLLLWVYFTATHCPFILDLQLCTAIDPINHKDLSRRKSRKLVGNGR